MYELPRPLEQMKMEARRDDWHLTFVGSDIRQLIGAIETQEAEITRLQGIVDKTETVIHGWIDRVERRNRQIDRDTVEITRLTTALEVMDVGYEAMQERAEEAEAARNGHS